MADAKILLVRHSHAKLDLSVPAKYWKLSEEGRLRAASFASTVAAYRPVKIYHSTEAKARETATIIAGKLDCPTDELAGVQEHDRSNIVEMDGETFRGNVVALLKDPVGHQFGGETGVEVARRVAAALDAVHQQHPSETVAIASHGTAITLFLSHLGLVDPIPYWQALQLPDLVILHGPPWQLSHTTNPVW